VDNRERANNLLAALIMRASVDNGEPDGHIDAAFARTLAINCASFWLRDAIRASLERDCVDALKDALTLAEIMRGVCDEALVK
jgi:hypothetical protein